MKFSARTPKLFFFREYEEELPSAFTFSFFGVGVTILVVAFLRARDFCRGADADGSTIWDCVVAKREKGAV